MAIGAFIEISAPYAGATLCWSYHTRATPAVRVSIRTNCSSEIPVAVRAMAQGQECADHNDRDRRVEHNGTLFLREHQCKKHYTQSSEDCHQSRLAAEPASL